MPAQHNEMKGNLLMLNVNRNALLGATAFLFLTVLHGCGAGLTPTTVHAAELSDDAPALQVQTPNAVSAVRNAIGTITISGLVGQTLNFPMPVAGGKAPYQWSLVSGSFPKGVSLSGAGIVSGGYTAAGTWNALIQVADSEKPAKALQQRISFVITAPPLVVPAASLPAGQATVPYNATLNATGGTPTYTWAMDGRSSLPAGLSLSPNGVISGTPAQSGTSAFTVVASDSGSPAQKIARTMAISIANAPLAITSTAIGNAQQGSGYSATLRATGGNGVYFWSMTSGSLPAGLFMTGAGTIFGSPQKTGTFPFTVSVQDNSQPAQRTNMSLSLVVTSPIPPLNVTTGSLAAAASGSSYNSTLAATGGTPGYTWSLASGSLPSGLTLSSNGVISGTPSTTGTSAFTVAVTDAGSPSLSSTKTLSLVVAATPLTITTGSFTAAQSNSSYTAQLSATGGTQGYTWAITSGSLPAGLALQATTGTITGTPSSNGNSSFTYSVTDNSKPQQTATATGSITVGMAPNALTAGTTWFVRPDGGNRYDPLYTLGQCDGKADAPYPGKGYNQHCAFSDIRYMWMVGTYGNSGWVMQGGDTLVIRGCYALPSQQNSDGTHCRIGWDKATGNDSQNFWGSGVNAWWGLSMPPPPSGTATQHTRILGECAYGNYSCNPVNTYPYTNNNLTQIYGSFASTVAIYLSGSQYVDLEGLEITTHNGKCARYGTTNPLPGCNRGAAYPLSDQADQGIVTDQTTSNILLQDIYVHGFSSSGITGPIGANIVANRVSSDFNAFAGWNFDNGRNDASSANGPHASLEQHYVTMVGNGCQEEYPIVHTQFPAKGCWDSQTGGFGDAWSGQGASMDSFTCDHCYIAYNTKDGAMGPHTGITNISLTNSAWVGNMGQDGKWGQSDNSTFLFQNNVLVGNCMRMSQQLPGAAMNFASQTLDGNGNYVSTNSTPGQGLAGYCRAAGPLFDYFSGANSTVQFDHNTIVTYQPTIFVPGCFSTGNCASSPISFTNNIVLGYTSNYNIAPFNTGQAPGLFYKEDSSVPITASHNIWYGIKSDYNTCNTNGTMCTDPLLVNELAQGAFNLESQLDNFNFHPSAGSPAIAQGLLNVLTPVLDFFGIKQTATPTIGAAVQ